MCWKMSVCLSERVCPSNDSDGSLDGSLVRKVKYAPPDLFFRSPAAFSRLKSYFELTPVYVITDLFT